MNLLKYQECIDACLKCAIECESCSNHCLNEEDVEMLNRCIKLNRDCASLCFTAAKFMSGESEFVNEICKICAELALACAKECDKHSYMEHCKVCAHDCRVCAEECQKMIGAYA